MCCNGWCVCQRGNCNIIAADIQTDQAMARIGARCRTPNWPVLNHTDLYNFFFIFHEFFLRLAFIFINYYFVAGIIRRSVGNVTAWKSGRVHLEAAKLIVVCTDCDRRPILHCTQYSNRKTFTLEPEQMKWIPKMLQKCTFTTKTIIIKTCKVLIKRLFSFLFWLHLNLIWLPIHFR